MTSVRKVVHTFELDTPDFGALIGVGMVAIGLLFQFGVPAALIWCGLVVIAYCILIAYFEQRGDST